MLLMPCLTLAQTKRFSMTPRPSTHDRPRQRPSREDLLRASATTLAARIRSGELSCAEVVHAHIHYAQQINPRLNALVCDRFDEARREADAADVALRHKDPATLGALHGVPCSIKESFALAGMPNSAGLVARRDVIASEDAEAVRRVRAAGAIPMGVTNVPELCMWYETHNYIYGRTNNAYSEHHICGGSSGGEGALVGSGASPFGLGSDIGGSIRMPAFFNGVFGHKPTGGLVPSTGQYPRSQGAALRYYATGPLCRRAQDLEVLTGLLAGPDGKDLSCREDIGLRRDCVDVSGLRVFVMEQNGMIAASPEIRAGVRRASEGLKSLGCEVSVLTMQDFSRSFEVWSAMLGSSEGPSFAQLLGQGEPVRVGRELWRWGRRESAHTLPALLLAMVEKVTQLASRQVAEHIERGGRMREQLSQMLGEDGILLFAPFPEVAPRHLHPLYKPAHFAYTGIFNVLEFPVTQVPMGLGEAGLPLGVQVVAGHGQDHVCLAVARQLEDLFGGWVPPWEHTS